VKSEESLRSMSDATLALSARVNVDEILGSSGTSAVLLTLIHRRAWKGNSANFALTEFSEVRRFLCVLEHIHSSRTGVCCVRYAASGGRVKAQDSYLPSS
jgi:hypothetical protein